MPRYHRVFERGHLQFITSGTYPRAPWVGTLGGVYETVGRIFKKTLDM
jgi:hypothetical protein